MGSQFPFAKNLHDSSVNYIDLPILSFSFLLVSRGFPDDLKGQRIVRVCLDKSLSFPTERTTEIDSTYSLDPSMKE
jgi:hypothetical protein